MKTLEDLWMDLYDIGCIKFGEFKLKSQILSPVYIDLRKIISYPTQLDDLSSFLTEKICDIGCDRIAGIPYAGIPIAVATSLWSRIPMIYPRKEVKDYGTAKAIEGIFEAGENILVIDDVITDGASKIEAIKPLEDAGLVVKDVLVVVDREQGGAKILEKAGYQLHSLGKLTEILKILVDANKVESSMVTKVVNFLSKNQLA